MGGRLRVLKNTYHLYTIRRRLMTRNALWAVTMLVIAAFLGAMYSFPPAYVCSSYLVSSVFMYFLGIYLSMNLHAGENDVFEEILLLHADSDAAYYLSREMLQARMCLICSLILSFFPLIYSIIRPGYFTRAIMPGDVCCGAAVILFCGFCGAETGDFFHPRFIGRRYGICFAILISVVALCKQGLMETFAAFGILEIFMPPVTDSLVLLGNSDNFEAMGIFLIVLHMFAYSLVMMCIKILLLRHSRYRI